MIRLLIFLSLSISTNSWAAPDNAIDVTIHEGDLVHFEALRGELMGTVTRLFPNGQVSVHPILPRGTIDWDHWLNQEDISKSIGHYEELSVNDAVIFEHEGYDRVGIVTHIFSNGRVRIEGILNAWGNSELIERHFWRDAEEVSKRVNHLGEIFENDEVHTVDDWGHDWIGTVTYLFSNGKVRIALNHGGGFLWTETDDLSLSERTLTLRREREERERRARFHQREFDSLVRELYRVPLSEHCYFQRLSIRAPQAYRPFLIPLLNTMRAEVESDNTDPLFVNVRIIISGTELRHLAHIKWNIRISGAEIVDEDPLFVDNPRSNRERPTGEAIHRPNAPTPSSSEGFRIGERSTLSEEEPLPALSRD